VSRGEFGLIGWMENDRGLAIHDRSWTSDWM
jgi:hypothetical protein